MYDRVLIASQRIILLSNMLGSLLCFLYYLYVLPIPLPQTWTHSLWTSPLVAAFGLLMLVTGVSRLLLYRWTNPLAQALHVLDQNGIPPEGIPESLGVRLLRYPLVVAGFIFLSWLLCGLVTSVILTLVTPMDVFGCLRVFFGPAFAMGAATGLLAFLAVEQRIRRVLPVLFPQGILTPITGLPTVRQRLLAVFFLVSLLPLTLLGSLLSQQEALTSPTEQIGLIRPLLFVILLLGLGYLLSFALSFAVAKSLVDPLHTLQAAMASLSRGQLETRVPVVSTDELGEVSRGFNSMATELQAAYTALEEEHQKLAAALRRIHLLEQAKSALSQFVPLTVYRLIEENPERFPTEKVERDVSVLFLDIAGYVRLSEAFDPATVNTLIETYFSRYVDAIYAQGGDINETAGDGLMVLFQQDDPSAHAEAAVRTALAILQQTTHINRRLQDTLPPVTLRIGINSGLAAVGITKFQGVTGTRWTYTASGPTTNIAARLAALAEAGEILISEETARRLGDRFPLQFRGKQQLKHVGTPLLVYQVCAVNGSIAIAPDPAEIDYPIRNG